MTVKFAWAGPWAPIKTCATFSQSRMVAPSCNFDFRGLSCCQTPDSCFFWSHSTAHFHSFSPTEQLCERLAPRMMGEKSNHIHTHANKHLPSMYSSVLHKWNGPQKTVHAGFLAFVRSSVRTSGTPSEQTGCGCELWSSRFERSALRSPSANRQEHIA